MAFKNALLKPFGEFGISLYQAPVSLHSPSIKLSLLQTVCCWYIIGPTVRLAQEHAFGNSFGEGVFMGKIS